MSRPVGPRTVGVFDNRAHVSGHYDSENNEFFIYRSNGNWDVYEAEPDSVNPFKVNIGKYKRTDYVS